MPLFPHHTLFSGTEENSSFPNKLCITPTLNKRITEIATTYLSSTSHKGKLFRVNTLGQICVDDKVVFDVPYELPEFLAGSTNTDGAGNGDYDLWFNRGGLPVSVSIAVRNALAYAVELIQVGKNKAYVGFTAGCGAGYEEHWVTDFTWTSAYDSLNFTQFKASANLLNTAILSGGNIRLTPASIGAAGQSFFTPGVRIVNSLGNLIDWSSTFTLQVGKYAGAGPADGIVFTLQSQSATAGSGGGGIGYYGITNSVGVEFDTWRNNEYGDPNANHIGIDVNGSVVSLQTANPSFSITGTPSTLNTTYCWVDYAAGTLSIFVSQTNSKPGSPLLSRAIDLRDYLVLQ